MPSLELPVEMLAQTTPLLSVYVMSIYWIYDYIQFHLILQVAVQKPQKFENPRMKYLLIISKIFDSF